MPEQILGMAQQQSFAVLAMNREVLYLDLFIYLLMVYIMQLSAAQTT
jgi:hypothetical protein